MKCQDIWRWETCRRNEVPFACAAVFAGYPRVEPGVFYGPEVNRISSLAGGECAIGGRGGDGQRRVARAQKGGQRNGSDSDGFACGKEDGHLWAE